MTNKYNNGLYLADDGKLFVRKSDGFVMGDGIELGEADDISNYEEREFSEEERAAFWESIGMADPKKLVRERKINNRRKTMERSITGLEEDLI